MILHYNTTDQIIHALNQIIVVCSDSARNFQKAAESLSSDLLQTLFQSYAQQRRQFAIALKAEVRRQGGKPANVRSPPDGDFPQLARVEGGNDQTIIAQCRYSEEQVLQTYEKILQTALPADVITLIQRQSDEVVQVYRNVRRVERRIDGIQ